MFRISVNILLLCCFVKSLDADVDTLNTKVTERVYMDVAIGLNTPKRIVFGLFGEVVPLTARNFSKLAQGGTFHTINKKQVELSYKNSIFHRIIPNFIVQGGDFTNRNGTGGFSIYGETFPDENFVLNHDREGLLSMANRGKNTNSSQFFITLRAVPHLDKKHVVFGSVLEGMEHIREIGKQGTHQGNTNQQVRVVDCGVLYSDANSSEL